MGFEYFGFLVPLREHCLAAKLLLNFGKLLVLGAQFLLGAFSSCRAVRLFMLHNVKFSYLQSLGHLDGDYFIALFYLLLIKAVEAIIPLYFSIGLDFDIVCGSLFGNRVFANLELAMFERLSGVLE